MLLPVCGRFSITKREVSITKRPYYIPRAVASLFLLLLLLLLLFLWWVGFEQKQATHSSVVRQSASSRSSWCGPIKTIKKMPLPRFPGTPAREKTIRIDRLMYIHTQHRQRKSREERSEIRYYHTKTGRAREEQSKR